MFRFPREMPIRIALLAILALVASACVQEDDPGVRIELAAQEISFGIPEEEEPAPLPVESETDDFEFPDLSFDFGDTQLGDLPPLAPFRSGAGNEGPCPKAADDAAAVDIVEPILTGLPREGVSTWLGREVEVNEEGERTKNEPLPDQRRLLRNYEKIDDDRFRFETVQPFKENFLISVFEVETAGERVTPPPEAGAVELPTSAGEPERGLVLRSTRVVDADGNQVPGIATFEPEPGLLLLPVPVQSGERFSSVAVDPRTGQTVFQQSTVRARERIDACGDPIDGWMVTASQTIANGEEQRTFSYNYLVATQYGAAVILEQIGVPEGTQFIERQVAQLFPDPLPNKS